MSVIIYNSPLSYLKRNHFKPIGHYTQFMLISCVHLMVKTANDAECLYVLDIANHTIFIYTVLIITLILTWDTLLFTFLYFSFSSLKWLALCINFLFIPYWIWAIKYIACIYSKYRLRFHHLFHELNGGSTSIFFSIEVKALNFQESPIMNEINEWHYKISKWFSIASR